MSYEDGMIDDREQMTGKVGGWTTIASATVTRPDNTTQYASGDVIADDTTGATVLEIPNCARQPGGSGVIVSAQVVDGANQATKADLEVWLFTEAPTADQDNAAFTPTDAELLARVAMLDMGSSPDVGDPTVGADGNCVYQLVNLTAPFRCVEGETSLYPVLVLRNTYTPVEEETFTVMLGILQD